MDKPLDDRKHPDFLDQHEYVLYRIETNIGIDDESQNYIKLYFRHKTTPTKRCFCFKKNSIKHLPVANEGNCWPYYYVACIANRRWEHIKHEVGDTDPASVWFWSEEMHEE